MSKHERAANIFWFVLIVGSFVAGSVFGIFVGSLVFMAQGPANLNIMDVPLTFGMGVVGGIIPCFIAAILCYGWVMLRGSFSYLAAAFIGLFASYLFFLIPPALEGMPPFEWQTLIDILKLPAWLSLPSALATRWLMGRFALLRSDLI